jgi:exoribonuclease R
MTSRGVPIFRFIPYDKLLPPLAVGCSQRNLLYNVHAIVEPSVPPKEGQLQRANLVQNLGNPTDKTELEVIIAAYAYDNSKQQKSFPSEYHLATPAKDSRPFLEGLTFHIDPPGCKDVDDTFTVLQDKQDPNIWNIAINIADVSELVLEGSVLDLVARQRATSFYTPSGEAIYPMLPKEVSEERASLLPGLLDEREMKPTLSLCITYNTHTNAKAEAISQPVWQLTYTQTTASYTYDEANESFADCQEIRMLAECASKISGKVLSDSHEWVEKMMIFYNQCAGELLAKEGTGILRRHAESQVPLITATQEMSAMSVIPEFLFYESAEYCLSSAETTRHYGLNSEFYAYASSPIRRYADLVNQRIIKQIIRGQGQKQSIPLTQDLVDELNRRQKQAKAFSRDLFFMTNLSNPEHTYVKGIVISQNTEKTKTKIWVPEWKRKITSRSLAPTPLTQGTELTIQWYEAREQARWKDRIVFKLESINSKQKKDKE